MNISLPAEMQAWVEGQAKVEGFATGGEYVRAMIEHRMKAFAHLSKLIQDGIDSGDGGPADEAFLAELRSRIGRRHAAE